MKLITVEEHFAPAQIPGVNVKRGAPPLIADTMPGAPWLTDKGTAFDVGDKRLAYMDADGVTMQVISTPFAQSLSAEVAVDYCRRINDWLAEQVARHPDRFAGFAVLPTAVPGACAAELERAVKDLGLVGALIGNRVGDGTGFLSDLQYEDLLAKAEELESPLYLHPGEPPKGVTELCYNKGLSPDIMSVFSRYGYGWHIDSGIHMLNLILTGVFDRHPKLQVILGHWGELLPFFIDRFDAAMPGSFLGIRHDPSFYLRNNMYVTPSGIFTPECLEFCVKVLGAERILFSIDYPFAASAGKEKILEHPMLTAEMAKLIAYGNAERLLRIKA